MNKPAGSPTTYEVLRQHGVDRRDFLRFCVTAAAAMGLQASMVSKIVSAMETKPRIPMVWLLGLECASCSESFIRSSHISLDYDDTLQAAAGFQVEEIRKRLIKEHPGGYLLAVEGNAPTADGGVYCTVGGQTLEARNRKIEIGKSHRLRESPRSGRLALFVKH